MAKPNLQCVVLAFVAAECLGGPAGADGVDEAAPPGERRAAAVVEHVRNSPQLADDPFGLRSSLDERGVGMQLFFNTVLGAKVAGGLVDGDRYRNSGSYDLFVYADLEELLMIPGLEVFSQTKGNYGRNINPFVGAISDPIDDADFDAAIYIAQLWVQQNWLENRVRLRLGYEDQQTVFDRNACANSEDLQFLAAALDNNPLVPLKVGLGATLLLEPSRWLALALGVADADNPIRSAGFDTAFDGFSSLNGYLESTFRVRWRSSRGALPGGYRFGVFLDNAEKTRVDGSAAESSGKRGHVGGYLSFDQLVLREGPRDGQGLSLFARYGIVDERFNAVAQFWSVGMQYLGAINGRDDDVVGIGVYQAFPSGDLQPEKSTETGLEVYYRIDVLPWLAVTPDVQVTMSPGTSSVANDAVILGLRARVSL